MPEGSENLIAVAHFSETIYKGDPLEYRESRDLVDALNG
jgi:hypothetical protein